MATKITQLEDVERGKTILRVEGSMKYDDAVLLEKIALEIQAAGTKIVALDLSDLNFLDSESASVLRRMKTAHNFEIEGIEFFLQAMINETERRTD